MVYFNQFMEISVKLVAAVVINLSLFLIIPVTEDVYGVFTESKKDKPQRRKMVAEVVKPKKKPQPKKQNRRIRDVSSSKAQSVKSPMKFQFTPDLTSASSGDGVAVQTNDLEAEVFEEGEVDVQATPVYRPQITYPEQAKNLGVEGKVTIQFRVGTSGKVTSIEMIEAPHPSFKKEIRKILEKWKFNPAQKNGVPVESRVRQSIDFTLE